VPKYLLPLGSETILAEIIKQFKLSVPYARFLLIANRSDQIFFPIVRSIMSKYSIPSNNLIYIDNTSSQLETALYTKDLISREEECRPCAFANIDTVLYNRNTFFSNLQNLEPNSGQLDTFHGESSQYSYARLDKCNRVMDVVDKNVISLFACSGLYGFGSYACMAAAAAAVLRKNGVASFTDLYKEYICLGYPLVVSHSNEKGHTIVLGTPDEYVINIHRFC